MAFRLVRRGETGACDLRVFVEGTVVIDFDKAAAVLDPLDPRLGPSLLSPLYRHLDLTPAFTPEVAHDFIRMYYWYGEDDETLLLAEARDDLTRQHGGDEGAFTDADVHAYAGEHFLTRARVDERLEPRYQEPGPLSLGECRGLCQQHGLDGALPVIAALETLGELQGALPEPDLEPFEGELPFSLVVAVGGDYDLVREVYGEYEGLMYQGGVDFRPAYALPFDPDDPESLETLKDALAVCRLILEATDALVHALEALP